MMLLVAGSLFVAGLFLPAWGSALAILTVLATGGVVPDTLFSLGSVDVRLHDPLVAALLLRWLTQVVMYPSRPFGRTSLGAIFFVLLLLPGMLGAAVTFGSSFGAAQLPAYARFATEMLLVPAFATARASLNDVRRFDHGLWLLAWIVGGTIVIGRMLLALGIRFGEVQVSVDGTTRAFGVAGDQAAFFLTFFIFLAMLRRRYLTVAALLCAILLTGSLGALGVLALGALLLGGHAFAIWRSGTRPLRAGAFALGLLMTAALAGTLGPVVWRVIASRVADGFLFSEGSGIQRLLAVRTAADIAAQHPVFGVGYGGFLAAAVERGATELFTQELQSNEVSQNFFVNANNQLLQTLADGGLIGLVGLLLMFIAFGSSFRRASRHFEPAHSLFVASLWWMVAMVIGNQTAVWILPGSLLGGLLFVLAGFAGSMLAIRPAARHAVKHTAS